MPSGRVGWGVVDDETDYLYLASVFMSYAINVHFSAEAGWNYSNLSSDIPNRSFNRNVVYFGLRATY